MDIETKTISNLKGLKFYVPAYQRGYRWTKYEINALLDDILEFKNSDDKKYCIQPLIVKRKGEFYEVVDGQQRLTTIYIFMKIAEQEIKSAIPPFSLVYETRPDSEKFLTNLSDNMEETDKNIDFYHIYAAYKTINNWLNKQEDKSVAIQTMNTKIRTSVFFIWYELGLEVDPINMFTKVNLGKIPLTDSELIKALLLNKDNFRSAGAYRRQNEISLSWDKIEQGLQEDSFWYFLNEKIETGTRIDMLFDILADEFNFRIDKKVISGQKYFTFLVFTEYFNKIQKDVPQQTNNYIANIVDPILSIWGEVEKLYDEFRSWYEDNNKFHIIGYLIAVGVSKKDILKLVASRRKSESKGLLLEKIRKVISNNIDVKSIAKLEYGKHTSKIRSVLLLFNIATIVCMSESQYRFPFHIYKGGSSERFRWDDVEHIHASADETAEQDNNLGNLTLLNKAINRSPEYAAKQFLDKRTVLLERESKGLFIPICTKNVFLKAYSSDVTDMTGWTETDKIDYLKQISKVLEVFLEGNF